ncbi:MAG: N-acetyl-gamma-glutamyl-phosphate reductase, partial [Muribaculaceae bacterium]|nr:N-acetyl-gamma-glutamyl-phosphate reductase [Muribaculaceae bacterium]
FARGIFATVYFDTDLQADALINIYKRFYEKAVFTHYVEQPLDLKQAVNTNKALVHVEKHGTKAHVISVIDNLLKGASGQAVQNMNLMTGLDEKTGLRLKASAF